MKRTNRSAALVAAALTAAVTFATAPPAAAQPPPGPCDLSWEIDDHGRLWLHHSMQANCGIAAFDYAVLVENQVITVRERGLCPHGFAVCLCFYDTDVVLGGLDPGEYAVDWQWCEWDELDPFFEPIWISCGFSVTIPDGPDDDQWWLVGTTAAGCGIDDPFTAVPEEPEEGRRDRSWSLMKTVYR